MYFDQQLCLFNIKATSQNAILTQMAQLLQTHNMVKDTFLDGILKREQEYPTGLSVNSVGFALPHTDSSLVNHSQICFASLAEPINFCSMVDKSEIVPVSFIFMLAMKQPHEQLENLQNLVALFQNEISIKALKACCSQHAFITILTNAGVK